MLTFAPASGPLNLLFTLSGMLSSQVTVCSLSSVSSSLFAPLQSFSELTVYVFGYL